MADIVSPLDVSPIASSASSSKAIAAVDHDDEFEDACSICLEPFNLQDPPTVTNCRHEYHLQCILEWSQRSKECPICWQLLVLKDPASQELLVAVENERNLRSRRSVRHIRDDYEIIHDNSYEDDSDFEERIMRHFAAAARRASYISRRGRQRISDIGPSQGFPSIIPGAPPESDMQRTHTSPEHQRCSYESSEGDSPTFGSPSVVHAQHPSPTVPEVLIMEPNSVTNGDSCTKPSHHLPESPQRPSSSEIFAFSESIKSKFSAASSRYKESISKGTRGFKEKLLARNISVKELGRGVQREMNAGIAGVARMIDRLDLASKRTEVSVPIFSCTRGTSNLSSERNDMQGSVLAQQETDNRGENSHVISSAASSHVHSTISSKLEAPTVEGGN